MNTRAASIATLACAVLGCWLPSLWLPGPVARKRSILPPPVAAREPAGQNLQTKVRRAGSAFAQFQAVAAGVRGRGASLAFHIADMGDLGCEEAEELAARLAGEELAAGVTDGAAFLASLRECDSYARESALAAWADADPDAALAALIADASDEHGVEDDLIQRLAARDPDKALALLKAAAPALSESSRNEVWHAVLAACAGKGTDYALAAIQSAPREAQGNGLASLLRHMAASDPRAALAWRESLPPELRNLSETIPIFQAWVKTEPTAALNAWLEAGNLVDGSSRGYVLATTWAYTDPEALFQWALAKGEGTGRSIEIAAQAMAGRDPQRALEMVNHLPDASPELRRNLLQHAGANWAQRDTAAALAWARSLPPEDRSYILNGMSQHLTSLPPEERRALAQEIGIGTSTGFQLLWGVDRGEAITAFNAMPPQQKLDHFNSLASNLIQESPATAASLLQSVIEELPASAAAIEQQFPASALPETVAGVASTWAGRDPAAAAAWVAQLPAGDSQATAAMNVALTWGRYDLPAAQAWVEQLPAGGAREKAAAQLAGILRSSGQEQP